MSWIMSMSSIIFRVCIIWAAVITVCICGPIQCPQDQCILSTSPEVKDNPCKDLDAYIKCMKLLSKKCRGDIGYHSALTASGSEFKKKCVGYEDLSRNNNSEHSQSMIPFAHNNLDCPVLFDKKKEHRFCGLFGDPHLRTFDGKYQTCRIFGAWQVIENPFFVIMVTNEDLLNSTTATVPTKLTVMLKAHKPECTHQKIYEAQGGTQLPSLFDDHTNISGSTSSPTVSLSWSINNINSETVIIRLSYISTIITVTRVGKYLSISAKLPDQLAQTYDQEKHELCSAGCPLDEQIDIEQSPKSDFNNVLNLCHNSIGRNGHRLTDQYLDWCIFDMMTSHDEQFINVSHAAYSDILLFEPRSLSYRTVSIFEYNPKQTADASSIQRLNLCILIIIALYNFF